MGVRGDQEDGHRQQNAIMTGDQAPTLPPRRSLTYPQEMANKSRSTSRRRAGVSGCLQVV